MSSGNRDSSELERLARLNNEAVAEVEAARDLYVGQIGPIEELMALRPENCIEVRRGDTPDVIDDRNVLFYTQDGGTYRNVLPRECAALTQGATNLSFPVATALGGRPRSLEQTEVPRCSGARFTVVPNGGGSLVALLLKTTRNGAVDAVLGDGNGEPASCVMQTRMLNVFADYGLTDTPVTKTELVISPR